MIRKNYIDIADGQMHYRQTLDGEGPPLVFFHMTAASSEAYVPVMQALEGRIPTIAFDSPNYGESFRTDRVATVEYMAECMLNALSAMGIEKFHTFGHHTGVSIQCEMAVQAPDRVLSTVINGPTYSTPADMAMFKDVLAWKNPPETKGTHIMKAWSRIRNNINLNYFVESPAMAAIMTRDTVDMLRAGTNWCWGYEAVFTHDLPDRMKHQRAPMLFICGELDVSYPQHCAAIKDFPDAPVYENPEGGVYYVETHPHEFADPIDKFLGDLNGAVHSVSAPDRSDVSETQPLEA